jgi:hypothetical protein
MGGGRGNVFAISTLPDAADIRINMQASVEEILNFDSHISSDIC